MAGPYQPKPEHNLHLDCGLSAMLDETLRRCGTSITQADVLCAKTE